MASGHCLHFFYDHHQNVDFGFDDVEIKKLMCFVASY
jgi:hypothetical protein